MDTSPDRVQVGGGHYKTMAYQPGHFSEDICLSALEGSVVRYVSRWRTKNGIEDLRKAAHTVELLRLWSPRNVRHVDSAHAVGSYIALNHIRAQEAAVIRAICVWRSVDDRRVQDRILDSIVESLTAIIEKEGLTCLQLT
jgi:hypothetical protein